MTPRMTGKMSVTQCHGALVMETLKRWQIPQSQVRPNTLLNGRRTPSAVTVQFAIFCRTRRNISLTLEQVDLFSMPTSRRVVLISLKVKVGIYFHKQTDFIYF